MPSHDACDPSFTSLVGASLNNTLAGGRKLSGDAALTGNRTIWFSRTSLAQRPWVTGLDTPVTSHSMDRGEAKKLVKAALAARATLLVP